MAEQAEQLDAEFMQKLEDDLILGDDVAVKDEADEGCDVVMEDIDACMHAVTF